MADNLLPDPPALPTWEEELAQSTAELRNLINLNYPQDEPCQTVCVTMNAFRRLKRNCGAIDDRHLDAHNYENRANFYLEDYEKFIGGYRDLARYIIAMRDDLVNRAWNIVTNPEVIPATREQEMEAFRVKCVKIEADSTAFQVEREHIRGLFAKMRDDLTTLQAAHSGLPDAAEDLQYIVEMLDIFGKFGPLLANRCWLINSIVHENEAAAVEAEVAVHYMADVRESLNALCGPMEELLVLFP